MRRACAEQGVRSVSEFARSAVLRQMAHHGVTFAEDLNTLSVRLQELDGGLRDASARIRKLLGTRQSQSRHNTESKPEE